MVADSTDTSCDTWLPEYQWRTHHSRVIDADPAAVGRAVRAVTPGDMYVLRPLVFVRSIPARVMRDEKRFLGADLPVLEGLIQGVGAFTLAEVPDGDLVVGFVGEPWGLRQHWLTLTPQEYLDFDEPGNIKGLMAFSQTTDERGTRLRTETRVYATDPRSRRKFRFYWAMIEPFSSLIRRDWLAAAARAVEDKTGK